MAKKITSLLPPTEDLLRQFGERLRLARLRRRLTARQVAERAGMALMTLRGVERGGAGVTLGAYLAVMQVLGLEHDLDWLAKEDALGRDLQDARLPRRARSGAQATAAPIVSKSPKATAIRTTPVSTVTSSHVREPTSDYLVSKPATRKRASEVAVDSPLSWADKLGFAQSQSLGELIERPRKKTRKTR